jgi:hypothetical protein
MKLLIFCTKVSGLNGLNIIKPASVLRGLLLVGGLRRLIKPFSFLYKLRYTTVDLESGKSQKITGNKPVYGKLPQSIAEQ